MKKLALALLVGTIAACGGGGKTTLIDGAVDAQVACNPVMQTGCNAGEKCTWILDIDGNPNGNPPTNDVGHIGCVTAGTTASGGACNDATAAANGGADTCIASELCISRKCKPICDPQVVEGTAAAGACAADFSCSIYSGVFESGGDPVAGVCEPGCDPLTQKLKLGNLEACGSVDATKPSGTCVPSRGFLSFHCAPSGSLVYNNTDRIAPLSDSSGQPFGNGCAPGFIPFYREAVGSMSTVCTGLCAPLKVDNQIVTQVGHQTDNQGDKTALGKLVTDTTAVAGHAVCTPMVKGATGLAASFGEDCRFIWLDLAGGDVSKPLNSPYNNTLGVCFAYEKYLDVTIPQMTQKFPEKSCAELPPTAPDTDPYGSALQNGCYPVPPQAAASSGSKEIRKSSRWASNYRVAHGDAILVRHVFD